MVLLESTNGPRFKYGGWALHPSFSHGFSRRSQGTERVEDEFDEPETFSEHIKKRPLLRLGRGGVGLCFYFLKCPPASLENFGEDSLDLTIPSVWWWDRDIFVCATHLGMIPNQGEFQAHWNKEAYPSGDGGLGSEDPQKWPEEVIITCPGFLHILRGST